jgi:hypothetical protein
MRQLWVCFVVGMLTAAAAQGSGGGAALSPGFMPDPYVISYVAGGSVAASQYGSECAGNIASSPDHVLELGAFNYLKVGVQSASDTTLVIYGEPYGRWFCNDDSDGLNPVVEGSWAAGTYYVYVGSFDGAPDYNLVITEIP